MGIYCYTMRKDVKEVNGMTIGRFEFAFKDGWDAHKTRAAKLKFAFAEKAREALPDVEYIVQCKNFNDAAKWELPVYKINKNTDFCYEEPRYYNRETDMCEPVIVGYLVKEGRNFRIKKYNHEKN